MINFLIAYDDNDFELGDFFQASYSDISNLILANNYTISSIRGLDCTEININTAIDAFGASRFIFVGLSHGNDQELVAQQVFVSKVNAAKFNGSLFYTCACSCATSLGKSLMDAGCACYIGHINTAYVVEDYHQIFYSCQNYAIKEFVSTGRSIGICYDKMIEYYNSQIDKLVVGDIDDTVAAASLLDNRDVLVLYGDRNLVLQDFIAV